MGFDTDKDRSFLMLNDKFWKMNLDFYYSII